MYNIYILYLNKNHIHIIILSEYFSEGDLPRDPFPGVMFYFFTKRYRNIYFSRKI